uniref:Uncharacterized protein n=1 Tax=Triticum aestivum TaxID=4565 RepID=A0A3B6EJY4_WHEAT
MMYGHGIEGLGFFHLEVPDAPPPSPSLQAIVTVVDGVASPEMLEAELNHLYRHQWDWVVTPSAAIYPPWQPCQSASDSAIIFRGEVGPPLVQIAAIRAREILEGKLAEVRAALDAPTDGVPPSSSGPQRQAPPPPAVIRGRTRSRTAALRAQSASRVLGSSSPPMAP